MLADVYPQYAKVKWRFSRIHHYVDYTPFKKNKLIKKSCINFAELKKVNNYGMKIKKVK
jgi:hypothetical protein